MRVEGAESYEVELKMASDDAILKVCNLKTYFYTERGTIKAVDGVSFQVRKGESFGIVGESGSGKTVTSLSILRLVPYPEGKIVGGEIVFKGEDILKISDKQMRKLRGKHITMVPQDPITSLNPVYTIGNQIGEAFRIHLNINRRDLLKRVVEMLHLVHIPSPEERVKEYPHQFSGGMRQRTMIAMALSCRPQLIIADEPTTALDVTIQAQVLKLLKEVQEKFGTSIILITHDLGIVAGMCSRVAVMYAGRIVEQADVRSIYKTPKHPYTRGLIQSVPKIGEIQKRLFMIEGHPPNLLSLPPGCRFSQRCQHTKEQCQQEEPMMETIAPGHEVSCFRWREI
jgi:oligopeptide/dipeptide ABC transporter ATP-binding protein